jgi:uncharacterized membrane protein YfcA
MLTDPLVYAAGIPAVILYGLSKGGFSGVGLLSMPLLALVMSPVQAAAVMLPVLLAQDAVTVTAFRRDWSGTLLWMTLPGAFAGIMIGTLTAAIVTPDQVRLVVGLLAISFCLQAWFGRAPMAGGHVPHAWGPATLWGSFAGYSSFVIHAGGPPYTIYALPRSLSRDEFIASFAVFFAIMNIVKVPAYAGLGQFSRETLLLSLALMPAAIAGNLAGIMLVKRVSVDLLYRLIYILTFIVGIKLIYDGASAIVTFW